MVNHNYTLQKQGYFETLNRISQELDRQGIEYALVGGAGVQARIANALSLVRRTDISNIPELEHLLRDTKDFDITSWASKEDFVKFFNVLQASNHPRLTVTPYRSGSNIVTLSGNKRREKPTEIYMNYQTGPEDFKGLDSKFYEECIDSAQPLQLWNGNEKCEVNVAKPEFLVSSKLTRYDPKDIFDIGNLLRVIWKNRGYVERFDYSLVKEILERNKKGELYSRLEEIRDQILKPDFSEEN